MTQNPFETPLTQKLESERMPPSGAGGTFEIGQCMSDAWRSTWANFPLWLGVMIVGALINVVAGATVIGYFFVTPVLLWGNTLFMLNMLEDRAAFNDLFAGFSRYGAALLSMLGFLVIIVLLYFVGFGAQFVGTFTGSTSLAAIGALVGLVWMFGVLVRFLFAPFFIVDQGLGAIEGMKASWAATSDQKLAVVGLCLLAGVVAIAGLLALLIGVVASSMIAYMMFVSAYRQMVGARR